MIFRNTFTSCPGKFECLVRNTRPYANLAWMLIMCEAVQSPFPPPLPPKKGYKAVSCFTSLKTNWCKKAHKFVEKNKGKRRQHYRLMIHVDWSKTCGWKNDQIIDDTNFLCMFNDKYGNMKCQENSLRFNALDVY